jgi:hypothetical protein
VKVHLFCSEVFHKSCGKDLGGVLVSKIFAHPKAFPWLCGKARGTSGASSSSFSLANQGCLAATRTREEGDEKVLANPP